MDTHVLTFKYHPLDDKGQATGFLSTKGSFDGEFLTLGKEKLPAQAIMKCICVGSRLVVILAGKEEPISVPMLITRGSASVLNQKFNQIASVYQTQAHQELLDKAGKGHTFYAQPCPCCQCMIDLTGWPATPQVHCPFCSHILTLENPPADEKRYQLCSSCGLYSEPKQFTIAYFYFLFIVYGYSYKRVHMCNACARSEAWKMLGGNLLFIILVPMAIVQLIRAYRGGSARSVTFQGLDRANAFQTARQYDRATAEYEKIEQRLPNHAGVLFNHGLALQRSTRAKDAVVVYERALAACANFPPAARALIACYHQLGRKDDAERLNALWTDETDQAEPESRAAAATA
jgi:tetratricopeptide (TPR) repeat protein